jgi:predicted ester cyclase
MTGTFTDRIVDGKIVESWGNSAQMALFQQIGAIQGPLAAATT